MRQVTGWHYHKLLHQIEVGGGGRTQMKWGNVAVRPGPNWRWKTSKGFLKTSGTEHHFSCQSNVETKWNSFSLIFSSGLVVLLADMTQVAAVCVGGGVSEKQEETYQAVWTSVWFFSHSRTWRYMTIIWDGKTIRVKKQNQPMCHCSRWGVVWSFLL